MNEWIISEEPPEGIHVEVKGTSFAGNWVSVAYRKDYKKGSTKSQLRRVWRWMKKDGSDCWSGEPIEAWRYIK